VNFVGGNRSCYSGLACFELYLPNYYTLDLLLSLHVHRFIRLLVLHDNAPYFGFLAFNITSLMQRRAPSTSDARLSLVDDNVSNTYAFLLGR
jgi:hypothetical protein